MRTGLSSGWMVVLPYWQGGATSFQMCSEFSERILLWSFQLTAQKLIFLTSSPWGWDVDLKRWSDESDLPWTLYLPDEMNARKQEGDLTQITEYFPLVLLTGYLNKAQGFLQEQRGTADESGWNQPRTEKITERHGCPATPSSEWKSQPDSTNSCVHSGGSKVQQV